ncbi:acyl carrier protein [Streptantibioticus rubrisoli]|uniref:Acyl carrier protein n=1 Tax=Streptantibioticus rubrisoli TaxID=1387313 RepID=A0ABT1P787_9ACTN|nr:acyl carrier protein [Streptantibioticus rubrisoli]MCQ4041244.1 acyl carrier protein [Streptantibioticus rubrisoli]
MSDRLTFDELASLMKSSAGVTVDAGELESHPDAPFAEFGLDSLGLLGIAEKLEHRFGQPVEAETCKTPAELLDLVNSARTTGA